MKKEKQIQFSKFMQGGMQGGMLDESNKALLFSVLVIIYCILFIISLILLTKIIINAKLQLLSVQNRQDLCKKFSTYENDTVRYGMYRYFQDTSRKNKFQKNYLALAITEIIIGIIILVWSIYKYSTYSENAILPKFSSVTYICLISLALLFVGIYISRNQINTLYSNPTISDYASKLSILKSQIFTTPNLQQLLSTYNSENIVSVNYTLAGTNNNINIDNLTTTTSFLTAINTNINKPLDASVITTSLNNDSSGNPILNVTCKVFSGADYKIVLENLGSNAAIHAIVINLGISSATLQPPNPTNAVTYGSLVILEETILRRLLQSNKTDILTQTDANSEYLNLTRNDVDTLISFINFANTSHDYKLLQSSVCGTSICNEGIGQLIKTLNPKNFTVFLADVKNVLPKTTATTGVSTATAPSDYQTTLQTFLKSVQIYATQLASELSTLQWNDQMWTALKTLISQDQITQCQCNGNPLKIGDGTSIDPPPGNPTQANVLSILNSLSSKKFNDPTESITKNLYTMNIYIISTYVFVAYITFHILYTIFNKKVLISVYFIILICIASALALTSQFPGK